MQRAPARTVGTLTRNLLAVMANGARPIPFLRYYAATDAVFEQAIGQLFIRGQVKFIGRKKGRRLALA